MPRHRLRRGILAMLLALIAVGITTVEARVVGDIAEQRDLAAFYVLPDPVPPGTPGSLVRVQELVGTPAASRAWRVLYRSTDLHGEPIVVSGIVVSPLGVPPEGGRTVLSWGHPTTGAARHCAPSLSIDPFLLIEGMRLMLNRGYTVVYTDYAGMGAPGPDSYLIGKTAGNNVLDAVRAAQAIPAAGAGDRVVLWGHSQGGQAVLFAAEQAAEYAPELKIEAVAVAAPAADLPALLDSDLGDISGVSIGSYAFTAYASVYGETVPGATLRSILSPEAMQNVDRMAQLCLLTQNKELHAIAGPLVGNFVVHDPVTTRPWAQLLRENSAGSKTFDAPLFVAQGREDKLVRPEETAEFVRHERSIGIDVTFEQIPIADHGTVAYLALPGLAAWLNRHVRP